MYILAGLLLPPAPNLLINMMCLCRAAWAPIVPGPGEHAAAWQQRCGNIVTEHGQLWTMFKKSPLF